MDAVTILAEKTMQSVACVIRNSGRKPKSVEQVTAVMRSKIYAFLTGEEFASERECLLRRSLSESVVWSAFIASIVAEIEWA